MLKFVNRLMAKMFFSLVVLASLSMHASAQVRNYASLEAELVRKDINGDGLLSDFIGDAIPTFAGITDCGDGTPGMGCFSDSGAGYPNANAFIEFNVNYPFPIEGEDTAYSGLISISTADFLLSGVEPRLEVTVIYAAGENLSPTVIEVPFVAGDESVTGSYDIGLFLVGDGSVALTVLSSQSTLYYHNDSVIYPPEGYSPTSVEAVLVRVYPGSAVSLSSQFEFSYNFTESSALGDDFFNSGIYSGPFRVNRFSILKSGLEEHLPGRSYYNPPLTLLGSQPMPEPLPLVAVDNTPYAAYGELINHGAWFPVEAVKLHFSQGVSSVDMVALLNSSGAMSLSGESQGAIDLSNAGVENTHERELVLSFEQPLPDDNYTLTIDPTVTSVGGELLDQNANGVAGELAADAYAVEFVVDTSARQYAYLTSVENADRACVENARNDGVGCFSVEAQPSLGFGAGADIFLDLRLDRSRIQPGTYVSTLSVSVDGDIASEFSSPQLQIDMSNYCEYQLDWQCLRPVRTFFDFPLGGVESEVTFELTWEIATESHNDTLTVSSSSGDDFTFSIAPDTGYTLEESTEHLDLFFAFGFDYQGSGTPTVNVSYDFGSSNNALADQEAGLFWAIGDSPNLSSINHSEVNSASVVELNFFDDVDASTFSIADLQITHEINGAIDLTAAVLQEVTATQYELRLSTTLADGEYILELGPDILSTTGAAMDANSNGILGEPDDSIQRSFSVHLVPPPAPVVTADVSVPTQSANFVLSGTKPANTDLFINGVQRNHTRLYQSTSWTATVNLTSEGVNPFSIFVRDEWGNDSTPTIDIELIRDTVAPAVTDVLPSGTHLYDVAPTEIRISHDGLPDDIDIAQSTFSVVREHRDFFVAGVNSSSHDGFTATLSNGEIILDYPSQLPYGDYSVSLTLVDRAGNVGDVYQHSFTITSFDAPLTVDPYPADIVTNDSIYVFSGTVPSDISIVRALSVDIGVSTATWSRSVVLREGANSTFVQARHGITGEVTPQIPIVYTYTNPRPPQVPLADITAVQVSGGSTGTQLVLDWSGYDAALAGEPVSGFRVFYSHTDFSTVSSVPYQSVNASTSTATLPVPTPGEIIYYAVMPVDSTSVTSLDVVTSSFDTTDRTPPSEAASLSVAPNETSLAISWQPAVPADADLSIYRLTVNLSDGSVFEQDFSPSETSYVLEGLLPASANTVKLATVDAVGNVSTGLSDPGVTLLPNPTPIVNEVGSGRVELSWPVSSSNTLTKSFALYYSTNDFDTVVGMQPSLVFNSSNSATEYLRGVSGLENDSVYYFAVLAVNLSDGQSDNFQTVSATPLADQDGPLINALSYDHGSGASPLTANQQLTSSGLIIANVVDDTAIGRVEFSLDGTLIGTATQTQGNSDQYQLALDLRSIADGNYTLSVSAYDVYDNPSAPQSVQIQVNLAAPPAPQFTAPTNNTTQGTPTVVLRGVAEPGSEVQIFRDAVPVLAEVISVNDSRTFDAAINLLEGANVFTATASYSGRNSVSLSSAALHVELDSSRPQPPTGVRATAGELGAVSLSWSSASSGDEEVAVEGYNIYRSTNSITDVSGMTPINGNTLVTRSSYRDQLAQDGEYFYRVVSVNALGVNSTPSQEVSALADSTLPHLLALSFASESAPFDAATGRYGAGVIAISMTFNEPLRSRPFFSINPSGGIAIPVELTQSFSDPTQYHGVFTISNATPSGTARISFSAFDLAGNRGFYDDSLTEDSLLVDTAAPQIELLVVTPSEPIQVNETLGATVDIEITFDEEHLVEQNYQLLPLIEEESQVIAGYEQGVTLTQNAAGAWVGQLMLPVTAGQDDAAAPTAETLALELTSVDDLGNSETRVVSRIQVYQGDLPPLDVPLLAPSALPDGQVQLNWSEVEGASGYVLYRSTLEEGPFAEVARFTLADGLQYVDSVSANNGADGEYFYSMSSLRTHNMQESESATSTPVAVTVDSVAPGAPTGLTLSLNGAGVYAEWQPPTLDATGADEQGVLTYRWYRLDLPLGSSVSSQDLLTVTPLEPVVIPQPQALDSRPSETDHAYVVVAVDSAGNVSQPSNVDVLSINLLPVSDLSVAVSEGGAPVVAWRHAGVGITGFDVYRDGIKLTDSPILSDGVSPCPTGDCFSFTDSALKDSTVGARTNEVEYRVVVVDAVLMDESQPSIIGLPAVRVQIDSAQLEKGLSRGLINQVVFQVQNLDSNVASAVDGAILRVTLDDAGISRIHESQPFQIPSGGFVEVPVAIGGYAGLSSQALVNVDIVVQPQPGQSIAIAHEYLMTVFDDAYAASVVTGTFSRNGYGNVQFSVTNSEDARLDLIVAAANGLQSSPDISYVVEDLEGNTLVRHPVHYDSTTADPNVWLASGFHVLRIPAGESVLSFETQIPIPETAPDTVNVRLEVSRSHYDVGSNRSFSVQGFVASQQVSLTDVPYVADNVAVSDSSIFDDESLTISGMMLSSSDSSPQAGALVKVVLSFNGFERVLTTETDSSGQFELIYQPSQGEGGEYLVSVLHPQAIGLPGQASFTVQSAGVSPTNINIRAPQGKVTTIPLAISADESTTLSNVRLRAVLDETGTPLPDPDGIYIVRNDGLDVAPGTTAYLNMNFSGSVAAAPYGALTYEVVTSVNGVDKLIDVIEIEYELTEAAPSIVVSPAQHLKTGTIQGSPITEVITFSNKGFTAMDNASFQLVSRTGQPVPSWIKFSVAESQTSVPVGGQQTVQLLIGPSDVEPSALHQLNLRLTADNLSQAFNYPIDVTVNEDGFGGVTFQVSDIYTGTYIDPYNPELGEVLGLDGALVKLENETTFDRVDCGVSLTDSAGLLTCNNVPPGRYIYRVSKAGHDSVTGRVWVKAGVVAAEEVFLLNQVVSVEWTVNEIVIEDRYEIVLEATYETDVPMAVVVFDPMSITLPVMKRGEIYQGEFRITNHGLLRAKDFELQLPTGNEFVDIEFFGEAPDALYPKQIFYLPFRVTALQDFDNSAATASGGGCAGFSMKVSATLVNPCISADVPGAASANIRGDGGGACGDAGEGAYYTGGGGGGGGGGVAAANPTGIGGTSVCVSDPQCDDDDCGGGNGPGF